MAKKKAKGRAIRRRTLKPPSSQIVSVEMSPERLPVFANNPKLEKEFTDNPTPAAVDATYAYLKKRGVILEGSPVLKILCPRTKLEEIRNARPGK